MVTTAIYASYSNAELSSAQSPTLRGPHAWFNGGLEMLNF